MENKITPDQLNELALDIKSNIHELKRCFTIEFMGLPKSGKTTIIRLLSHYLRRNDINCYIIQERASLCPIKGKQRIEFSIWNACSSLLKLLETYEEPQKTVIIFDRGIFDALVWIKTFALQNGISNDEFESIFNYFTNTRWITKIDLLIHLRTTVELSLQRENQDALIEKPGSIMNPEILTKYQENAMNLAYKFKKIAKDYQEYDTTITETKENAKNITISVLEKIKELSDEEVAVFPFERINIIGNIKKLGIINANEAIKLLATLESELYFDKRSIVEVVDDAIQIVAVTIIENENQIVVFQKYEKNSKQRFHLRNTLWVGGHLRAEDNKNDLLRSAKKCIRREIKEEILYEYELDDTEIEFVGIVYDTISSKSRKHLGLVFSIKTLDERLISKLDNKNISEKSGQSHFIEVVNKEDIFKSDDKNFENWSLAIAYSYLGISVKMELENQLELF